MKKSISTKINKYKIPFEQLKATTKGYFYDCIVQKYFTASGFTYTETFLLVATKEDGIRCYSPNNNNPYIELVH